MRLSPGRHSGQLHSVFDDVVDIAVGQILGRICAQVWHPGIEIRSHGRLAAAIDSVTASTLRQIGLATLIRVAGRRRDWVLLIPLAHRDGQISHCSSHHDFPLAGNGRCTEAAPHQHDPAQDRRRQHD